jgi:hypothetical protein
MVELLERFSRTIGDDTWLFDFAASGDTVKVSGFSSNVPALIERLQAEPGFQTHELTGPLLQSADSNRDRFELTVSLKPVTP